jgi:nitric oxide dioxygenase
MNNWKNINSLIEYPKEGILSKKIFKNNSSDITLFCLSAGSVISEHTSSKQGQVLVIDGKGLFNLAGENIKMESGVIIAMPANAKHSLQADENTSFILFLN